MFCGISITNKKPKILKWGNMASSNERLNKQTNKQMLAKCLICKELNNTKETFQAV